MNTADILKTDFITKRRCFAFKRMPFGLSRAVATFQRVMETVLKAVLNKFALVYLDEVIITSPSFNQHLEHLNKFFTFMKSAGFTLKTV